MGDWVGGAGAKHRVIRFKVLEPMSPGAHHQLGSIRASIVPGFEEDLVAQLNDVCSNQYSSPEYKKYRKFIPQVAMLFGEKFILRFLRKYYTQWEGPVRYNGELMDELFDKLGCRWLQFDQFEEALEAFNTCVEISVREGCWWVQKLCARYHHLAFAHMTLGNKPEQLRASIQGAAFAIIGARNISASSSECSRPVFCLSLVNLAAQFLGRIPDPSFGDHFTEDPVQARIQHVAERKRTLEKKLAPGQRHSVSIEDDDLYFALADFLVHNNRDSFKLMLEILPNSSSGSLSASELVGTCDVQTREFKSLMEVCQMDTPGAERAAKHREFLSFVFNALEVATLEPSSEDKSGWSLTCVPMKSLYTDENGISCYPGVCFSLSIKQDLEAIQDHDSSPSDSAGDRDSTPVHAEGSNPDSEFEAIKKRLMSKTFNLADPSESMEFANVGRDLGLWATSPSTAAEAPTEDIHSALCDALEIAETLRKFPLHEGAAKSVLQDIVWRLTEQFNANVKGASLGVLLEYVQICAGMDGVEERVEICTKAIRLAEEHEMSGAKYGFYFFLGLAYWESGNLEQAEEAFRNARQDLELSPDLLEDAGCNSDLNGAEGMLELKKAAENHDKDLSFQQWKEGVRKLKIAVQLIEEQAFKEDFHAQTNFMKFSTLLSDALRTRVCYPEALFVIEKAYRVAKALKDTKELKGSKTLKFRAAGIAGVCGFLNNNLNNYISAERFCREGLEILCVPGYTDETLTAQLHVGLGRALRSQDRLSEAEDAFREALNACSRKLTKSDMTSETRILTFELLKECYNELQLCLYKIYMQADEDERGTKAVEALVVAEQGRCRDLMMNLEQVGKSRTANESVSVHVIRDAMDWETFDTNPDYAWGHLKNCMASCTDAIREQNPEVERVTFVEYTLAGESLLIWVLHSRGAQDSSTSQETNWPSMYAVDVKASFQTEVDAGPRSGNLFDVQDDCGWMYGPHSRRSHFDHVLHKIQVCEAMDIFENRIEMLREAQGAGLNKKIFQLYDLLVKPIADELTIGEPLIFIPHEGLSYAPFAALKPKLKGSKHLIENHPIGYASSIRTLGWATDQFIALKAKCAMSSRHPMLLVADPELPPAMKKDPLDDATAEVNAIASLLPTNYSKLLTKKQATLENVSSAMRTASWFHIACHGEVSRKLYPQGVLFLSCGGEGDSSSDVAEPSDRLGNSDGPMHFPSDISGDLKTEPHRRDGCLTPDVITNKVGRMMAQAAVLAACKAAQGKKTGEGILGLSRAFTQVGVPMVIAPLKTIDSKLGSAFMQRFYKGLVNGESVMFALRNTMVDVIQKEIPVDDGGCLMKWQLWDWAAWVAVGFPGVCLPL